MPIEIALWRLSGDDVIPVPSSGIDTEERLEDALEKDISILGLDRLLVIGRQVSTRTYTTTTKPAIISTHARPRTAPSKRRFPPFGPFRAGPSGRHGSCLLL
jgi:hypothetical protein